jgi:hypothetical protein
MHISHCFAPHVSIQWRHSLLLGIHLNYRDPIAQRSECI